MYADKERKRIVVKIGSSSLTSFQGEISLKKLENLVNQIVKLKDEGHEVILVSSGAVAAGYRKLGFIDRPKNTARKTGVCLNRARAFNGVIFYFIFIARLYCFTAINYKKRFFR